MGRKAALVIALAAMLVTALPSLASAAWTHKGKGELKSNASVTLSGELTLSTSAGDVSCPTELGATLTASSSAGHVNSFTVSKPSECDLSGSLGTICGTHGLTKVEKTGTWALTADESDITLSGIDVDYVLAGCLIPSFRAKGSSTITLDKATAIGKATLGGSQTLYNAVGEESGTGELKGTLSVSPSGTYGVKTAATVETRWTDGNAQLSSDGKLTLTGSFSFSGSGGSISCPATVKLLLESSTVEEEEPEGEVESFTVSKPAECDLGGGYQTICGSTTNRISKVDQTGTATLTATEEDIKVAGLVLDYEFEKCAITNLRVEGSPTLTPANPASIGEATFSAGSLEVFNSKGETLNTASAGGSATASPSGTFQLKKALTTNLHWTEEGYLHMEGALGFNIPGNAIKVECEFTFEGTAVNLAFAHGTFEGAETGACETHPFPPAACNLEVMNFGALPWTLATSAEHPEIEIQNMTITNIFTAGCATFGWPKEMRLTGNLTSTFDLEVQCLQFTEAGDLKVEAPESLKGASTEFNGELCLAEGGPTLE